MRPPRARPAPKALSLSIPRSPTPHMPKRDKPHPVLRWFSAKHSRSLPRSHSRSQTPSPTPSSSTPSTPSSAASALADALGDDPHLSHPNFDPEAPSPVDLPTRPEAARLPAHFRPSQPPRFLSELTRSTLPTASLSPPPIYAYFDPFAPAEPHNPDLDVFYSPTPTPVAIPHSPAPAHVNRSRAGSGTIPSYSRRSSLDTLREIQERERTLHTTAAQQLRLPSLPDSIRSWFSTEEESIHPLLSEEDQRRTAEEEREHIRRKYYAPKNPIVFCHGLLGFDTVTLGPAIASLQVTHWRGIKEALEANGVEVCVSRHPFTPAH
ncbi:uncharacterized protein LAESUDRAFT_816901 [Laetiporus sulphureus 93-53]|uniref:Alpha/beta-hydrolase n=1 Tax=Laetiporus sulphureus 93-53 TaxID=1314785 RepID=A0A165AT32_9APHY|nr:uncharacterized protein LAESUDRAFT_816901 [Laetiporus sulphureus 93-53]KZS99604.1 hypothetical protein LAESUDRAFT_816901 [Laetiporus sulphureus 93-53]